MTSETLYGKGCEKYYKRYVAYAGSKTTESLMQSFLMLFSKGIGMVVEIDDVEALREDLYQDYILNSEIVIFGRQSCAALR